MERENSAVVMLAALTRAASQAREGALSESEALMAVRQVAGMRERLRVTLAQSEVAFLEVLMDARWGWERIGAEVYGMDFPQAVRRRYTSLGGTRSWPSGPRPLSSRL